MSEHLSIEISVPGNGPERVAALAQLLNALSRVTAGEFAEVWVDHGRFPVLCTLKLFAASKQVPESIGWHNDSEDGSLGPNDPDFGRLE